MASISTGGNGHGGKKDVDAEIPLIPFIDLLLCCVMFLLVTAVWNKLARINANQQVPGQQSQMDEPQEEQVRLYLQVRATGYRIEHGGHSICYITDTEHIPGKPDQNILSLIEGSDLVVYDSTYTEDCRPYIASKAIAERAAWDYVEGEGQGIGLTSICPVGASSSK